jgi:hypothetical protein
MTTLSNHLLRGMAQWWCRMRNSPYAAAVSRFGLELQCCGQGRVEPPTFRFQGLASALVGHGAEPDRAIRVRSGRPDDNS